MTDAAPATSSHVPKQGIARVKTVLSGDTVVLVGNPTGPNRPAPEILFSLQAITAPVRVHSPKQTQQNIITVIIVIIIMITVNSPIQNYR